MFTAHLTVFAGETHQPCFSINLSAPQTTIRSGYEFRAKVTLTMIRSCPYSEGKRMAEFEYTVDVRDSNGNAPLESKYSKAIKGKDGGRPAMLFVDSDELPTFDRKSGEAFTRNLDVSGLYDLSEPGNYTVQVSRFDGDSKTLVKSNTVTVTVVPNEAAQSTPSGNPSPVSAAPFSVTIWLRRTTTHDPFLLDVITKNISDRAVAIQPADVPKELLGSLYKVDVVVDSSGNPAPETDLGRSIGNQSQSPPSVAPPRPPAWNGYRSSLRPGEEWWDPILVNSLYDLSKAGEYTIQVRRWDPESQTWVKSNEVTDTVTTTP